MIPRLQASSKTQLRLLECALIASAALVLAGCLKHPAKAPLVPAPAWSRFQAPFDLVWQSGDANGLPLNPRWASQLSGGSGTPAFKDTCGRFYTDEGQVITQDGKGKEPPKHEISKECTNQSPLADVRKYDPDNDPPTVFLCPAEPVRGHLNWTVATYTGKISFDSWSSDFFLFDDDINFTLATPGESGLTTGNKHQGLHTELKAGETLDWFAKSKWWRDLNEKIHSPVPFLRNDTVDPLAAGYAVVTGLFGIDGVHGGHAESHPVFALALLTNAGNTEGSGHEVWRFFLRNVGGQGDCSITGHRWPATDGAYYVQFPWPEYAASVEAEDEPEVWSYQSPGVTAELQYSRTCALMPDRGCTLLRIVPPIDAADIGVFGEIKFRYSMKAGAQSRSPETRKPLAKPAKRPAPLEKESGEEEKVKQRLLKLGDTVKSIRQNMPQDLRPYGEKGVRTQAKPEEAQPIRVGRTITERQWPQAVALVLDKPANVQAWQDERKRLNETYQRAKKKGRSH
jgi:hypothetical protein